MSEQKTSTKEKSKMQADFEALPLDEKFKNLLSMEMATLTESFNYVVDSSSKAFDKMGDVFSDLSSKVETEFKKASAKAADEPKAKPAAGPSKSKKSPPKKSAK